MKIILSILVSSIVVGGGVYFWQDLNIKNLERTFEQKNALITNEKNQLSEEYATQKKLLEETQETLAQTKWRSENASLVFDIIKDNYFVPKPTNSTLLSLAILLDEESLCDDIDGDDKEFCLNIFKNNCSVYEYPNLETCNDFRILLDRKVTPEDLIKHCNSKDSISNDSAQVECFEHFAKVTSNVNLCYEICKSPIDNTNCNASCRDENNQLMSCKEQYIEQCVAYTL